MRARPAPALLVDVRVDRERMPPHSAHDERAQRSLFEIAGRGQSHALDSGSFQRDRRPSRRPRQEDAEQLRVGCALQGEERIRERFFHGGHVTAERESRQQPRRPRRPQRLLEPLEAVGGGMAR